MDWQEEYRREFRDEKARASEITRLKREIARADKRTYNGKLVKIFNAAKIIALQEE